MRENKNIKELILYAIITVILIIVSILNNKVWKLGKENTPKESINNNQEVQLLEINNITYNVPFEEKWLEN